MGQYIGISMVLNPLKRREISYSLPEMRSCGFFLDLSGSRNRIATEMIGRKKPIMNQVINGLPSVFARFPEMVGNTVNAEINMDVRKRRPMRNGFRL
jgi:hypothetical protein